MKTFALRKLMENKEQEDREDLNAFKERCNEPLIPLEEVVNGLSNKETCRWYAEEAYDTEHFSTSCDEIQYFSEGGIKDNGYKYCPYCSKPIEEANNE